MTNDYTSYQVLMSLTNVHLVTASNVFSVNDTGIPPIFQGHVIYLPLSSTKSGYFWRKQSHHRRHSINLMCKVVVGRPEPQITWLKNNTFQGQSLSLFFSEITREDDGWYTCKAENASGFSTKDIDISVKGVFIKLTSVLEINHAFDMSMECESIVSGPYSRLRGLGLG